MDKLVKFLESRRRQLGTKIKKIQTGPYYDGIVIDTYTTSARLIEVNLILKHVRELALTELTRIAQENDMGY